MRRRLAVLVVLATVAGGCSLLVEFDRGKLGSLESLDASGDVTTPPDGAADGTADGAGDVTPGDVFVPDAADGGPDSPTDAPPDAPTDAPIDAPVDAPTDAPPDAPVDAPIDSPVDAPVDSPVDAPPDVADAGSDAADAGASAHCTQAEFDNNEMLSQAMVTITFPESATPNDYTPRCVKVSAGTIVRFHGAFNFHPLQNDGPANNPLPPLTAALPDAALVGDLDVTFADPGAFDYQCQIHFAAGMIGAVQVVP